MSGLKAFEKCICSYGEGWAWEAGLFSHIDENCTNKPFVCVGGMRYKECVPYEGNEGLLGKAKKVAKPKPGEQWEALTGGKTTTVNVVREASPGVWLTISEGSLKVYYVNISSFIRLIREVGE